MAPNLLRRAATRQRLWRRSEATQPGVAAATTTTTAPPTTPTKPAPPAPPRPPPPTEPGPDDCCQSQPPCADCVWDRYARELTAWKAAAGEEGAAVVPATAAVAGVDAFAALEARLEREAAERRAKQQGG